MITVLTASSCKETKKETLSEKVSEENTTLKKEKK